MLNVGQLCHFEKVCFCDCIEIDLYTRLTHRVLLESSQSNQDALCSFSQGSVEKLSSNRLIAYCEVLCDRVVNQVGPPGGQSPTERIAASIDPIPAGGEYFFFTNIYRMRRNSGRVIIIIIIIL